MSRFLKAMRQRRLVAASLKTFGNAAVAASLRLIRTRSLRLGSDAVQGVRFASAGLQSSLAYIDQSQFSGE